MMWVLAIGLAACTTTGQTTTTNLPTTSSSTSSTTTLPPVVECPGAGEFGEGGGIATIDEPGSDATRLGQISWTQTNDCESFSFEFETSEGAPATVVPSVRIAHLETFQILRIYIDVDATIVTDQLVETGLVDRLFVVKSLDGGMFVDLHLREAAAARARVQTSPAGLSVDLRPGLVPISGQAAIGKRVVLASPAADSSVDTAANLIGYSRTFESNVVIVVSQDEVDLFETSTTAAGHIETWGEFRTLVTLPIGESSVFVGEASGEDGALSGVTVNLTAS